VEDQEDDGSKPDPQSIQDFTPHYQIVRGYDCFLPKKLFMPTPLVIIFFGRICRSIQKNEGFSHFFEKEGYANYRSFSKL